MKLGYFRIGPEAVAFYRSETGDRNIDTNPRTGKPYILAWRSDYARRKGRPVVMAEGSDYADMAALASDPALRPVTTAEWVAFQREGRFA